MVEEHFVGPFGQQRFVAKNLVVEQRAMRGVVQQIQIPRADAVRLQGKL